jgi:hypothetical protein
MPAALGKPAAFADRVLPRFSFASTRAAFTTRRIAILSIPGSFMDNAPEKNAPLPGNQVNARMDDLIHRIEDLCNARSPDHNSAGPIFKNPRPVLGIRCPRCNKRALRQAKRETFIERIALLLLFRPYRCRYCRYFEMRFILEDLPAGKRRASKTKPGTS